MLPLTSHNVKRTNQGLPDFDSPQNPMPYYHHGQSNGTVHFWTNVFATYTLFDPHHCLRNTPTQMFQNSSFAASISVFEQSTSFFPTLMLKSIQSDVFVLQINQQWSSLNYSFRWENHWTVLLQEGLGQRLDMLLKHREDAVIMLFPVMLAGYIISYVQGGAPCFANLVQFTR